jgi:hypothetical protein
MGQEPAAAQPMASIPGVADRWRGPAGLSAERLPATAGTATETRLRLPCERWTVFHARQLARGLLVGGWLIGTAGPRSNLP